MAFNDTKPHFALLDGLRGVAALLVVWYHIFEGYQFASGSSVITVVNHGYLAVDFFFILSGFVIGYAYDERMRNGTLSVKQFFLRRLIRLHPMVVMGAVIGFVSFALTGFERWDGTCAGVGLSCIAFLSALVMLPAMPGMMREVRGNGEMFPLNGPCWSLFYEYVASILYAILLRRLSRRCLAGVAIGLACVWAWFAITNQSGYGSIGVGWTIDPMNVTGGLLRMLCPFTIGLLLSRVFKPMRMKGAFWLCASLLVVLFHVPYIEGGMPYSANGLFEMACIIVVFPLMVWMAASDSTTDFVSMRICTFLGDISFPLYIVHYPLMYAFYRWLIHTKQYTFLETWPVALAVMASSILLAWLCLKCYDIPVRRRLTSWVMGVKKRHH